MTPPTTRLLSGQLLSLPDMRDQLIAALMPVVPQHVAVADALGAVLAAPVRAPHAMPAVAIALRTGHAVAALDLVGASPHSPVLLTAALRRVAPGETLPPGCDAVLPPDGMSDQGAFTEITQSPAPGESVRLAGHDLAAQTLLADRGARVSSRLVLAMTLAGLETVEIIRPRLVIPAVPQPERAWLAAACSALGCVLLPEAEADTAHLALGWSGEQAATLALHPGETADTRLDPAAPPKILLPRRFDGMIAAFFALVLPAIEHLTGGKLAEISRPLTRKIASSVGITDVILMKTTPEGYAALSTGEITLAALAEADVLALIPAESEGFSAGSLLAALPLDFLFFPNPTGAPHP
jgi:molybdopterin molybdotransferase